MRVRSSGFRVSGWANGPLGARKGSGVTSLLAIFLFASSAWSQVALDDDVLTREPSWRPPTVVEVRAQLSDWLEQVELDDEQRQQVEALWPDDPQMAAPQLADTNLPDNVDAAASIPPSKLLQRVVETIALVDLDGQEVVDLCSKPHGLAPTPVFSWLDDEQLTHPFVRHNLRLWLGKWLAQERRFDEATVQLRGMQPADVVDPATLLFYQSVCQHWMLEKTDGLKTIDQLMEQRKLIPRRYQQLAELMQADLAKLKDDTLDHISRRMNDVTRRLDLGHAGKRVRGVEDGIIASLDKLIEELEEQAGGGGGEGEGEDSQDAPGGAPGDPQGIQSRGPAADSRIAEGKGAGDVTSKNIGNRSGWGDLPQKEREEAIQQISREFPSHYRDIIEQYFRKLASEEAEK